MLRTAGMTATEFAQFVIDNTIDVTPGLVMDALQAAGAEPEEIDEAMESVQNLMESGDSTEIDVPDDIDDALTENEERLEDVEAELESGDAPLDSMPVDVPGDLSEPAGDDSMGGPMDEPPYGEDPMGYEPDEEQDTVELTPDELFEDLTNFMREDPGASEEDLKRHLHNLGVPGDKINDFIDKGMNMLKASSTMTNFILTSDTADISWFTAAQFVQQNNPNMKADEIRQALLNAGCPRVEVEQVMQQLPPPQPDPMMADPAMQQGMEGPAPATGAPITNMQPQAKMEGKMANSEGTSLNKEADFMEQLLQPANDDKRINELEAERDRLEKLLTQKPMPERRKRIMQRLQEIEDEAMSLSGNAGFEIGAKVTTPAGTARVAGVMPSFSGDIYEVEVEGAGTEFYGSGVISHYKEEKTAGTEGIFQRVASHMEEEWYTDNVTLPRAHKAAYEERLEATNALLREVKAAFKTASADEQNNLMQIDVALTHEARYINEKLKTAFTAEDAAYLTSQPKYRVAGSRAASEMGQRTAALDLAVQAAEEEAASVDWKREVTAGAELFVEEINPVLIGSSGDVRRMASRYITSKTAALDEDQAEKIRNSFIENAEKARRRVVKELRQQTPKQASTDLPDGASDEGIFG